MIDLFREIAQTFAHNKTRTALTGIAVSWGVFMLILLLSVSRGFSNNISESLLDRNTRMIKVYGGYTSIPYRGIKEGRKIKMKEEDMEAMRSNDRVHIGNARASMSGGGKVKSVHAEISRSYQGVYPDALEGSRYGEIIKGRFINDRDMQEARKVIVIEKDEARKLFPPGGDAVGQRVEINGLYFLVVGVFTSRWNSDVYIPYTTAKTMNPSNVELGTISVDLENVQTEKDGTEVENGLRTVLSRSHTFSPSDENAIYVSNNFNNSIQAVTGISIVDTGVWILGLLTLLTGIVGVSNIMFVTVRERTHEIGIRRAIGAKPRQILTQILAESVAITLVFGYIGIVFGTVVSQIAAEVAKDYLTNATVSLAIAVKVTVALVAAGALAGLLPAAKALKVKPVEALHDE